MYRGGYGGAGGDHLELAFPVGASTRLHAYADDIGYGDVLYRISSLYVGESIYGPLKRTKVGTTPVLLLV